METKPVGASLLRCDGFDCLQIQLADGRHIQLSSSHDDTIHYHMDELCIYSATEADVRNLIKQLTEIADNTWPKCPACGQIVELKEEVKA